MPLRRLASALLGLLLLIAAPATAASLRGTAEWSYARFLSRADGERRVDASHFTQQYSLYWNKGANLLGGRAGRYAVGLGGEWTAIEAEVNGDDFDLDTSKILYEGEILLAPGGLPFRLHLFSADKARTAILADTTPELAAQGILEPDIASDVRNGQHIVTGATLLLGIRNGSYLGRYRDVLSQLPRLLMDYRQTDVRNLKSNLPQHYRNRNLAFVSLNKKDNWFHYRFSDYRDYLDLRNDWTERSVMLGTIDHNLERQWINLTNWLKISADATYTLTDRVNLDVPVEQRYDIHLFANARRTAWRAAAYPTYSRRLVEPKVTKTLEVPLLFSGEVDRNTAWRSRFVGQRAADVTMDVADEGRDDTRLFFSTRADTFRQSRYIVSPELSVELFDLGGRRGTGAQAGFELRSNRRHRPRYDLLAAYSLLYAATEDAGGGQGAYWEHNARAALETDVTSRSRVGFRESLTYGTGESADDLNFITVNGLQGLNTTTSNNLAAAAGSVVRSTTTWFGELSSARRWRNRLELVYDYLQRDGEAEDKVSLRHALDYDRRTWSVRTDSDLTIGAETGGTGATGDNLRQADNTGAAKKRFFHRSEVRYAPGRTYELLGRLNYQWRDKETDPTHQWQAEQEFRYYLFTVNGIVRKLAEITEELSYERFESGAQESAATSFSLTGSYFPFRHLRLGGNVGYTLYSPQETDQLTWGLVAAADFARLSLALTYDYGTRSAAETSPELEEHRWELKLKKIF